MLKKWNRRSLGDWTVLAGLAFLGVLSNLRGQGSQITKPEIVVQTGSVLPNSRIVLSPDGRLLASVAFGENSIHLWEVDSQRQLRLFEATRRNQVFGMIGISEIEFSDNGDRLAAATEEEVDVWNVNDGECLYRFPLAFQHASLATVLHQGFSLSLSPSGRLLAWSSEGKIHVRDLANRGQEIPVPAISPTPDQPVVSLAFSRNERELVVLSTREVPAIDLINLAAGSIKEVARFDREGSLASELFGARLLSISPTNEIIIATKTFHGTHALTRVHNVTSGETFDLDQAVVGATISLGGASIGAMASNSLGVWDVRSKHKLFSVSPDANGPTAGRWTVDISRDRARLAVGDNSGAIRILDAQTGKQQALLVGHTNIGGAPVFDRTGMKLSGGSKTIWDLHSGVGLRTISGAVGAFSQAAADGSVYAEDAGNGRINLWDLPKQRKIATIEGRNEVINSLLLSPNGSLLAVVRRIDNNSPGAQALQAKNTKQVMKNYMTAIKKGSQPPPLSMYTSDDPQVQVQLYDARTGAEKLKLLGATSPVGTVAFTSDGTRIAAASSNEITIWDTTSGKVFSSLPLGTNSSALAGGFPSMGGQPWSGLSSITSLAFAPDGRSLAAGMYSFNVGLNGLMMPQAFPMPRQGGTRSPIGLNIPTIGRRKAPPVIMPASPPTDISPSIEVSGPVMVFDLANSRPSDTLKGHATGTAGLAFSDDGKLLATSGMDGFIRIWETASGSLRGEIPTSSTARVLVFRPGGKVLASSHSDGTTVLWDVESRERLATLVSLYDGADWLVVTPEGLFDGSPAAWNQILWRYSRNTFNVSPVESFFNEYFYPGLLADIMAGKRPKPPQQIAAKDRRQPTLEIEVEGGGAAISHREVTVRVAVQEAPASQGRSGGSGARDVRLFRNGSLVKVWRGDVLNGSSRVTLSATVPIVAGQNRLTAYAFNAENVKSRDAEVSITGDPNLYRKPTTYVLSVGVDRYENPEYNLRFAASDAQSLAGAVRQAQMKVEDVKIISVVNESATRSGILEAIAKLGKTVQPEDHVVLFFASHGIADRDRFYLVPFDLGYTGKRLDLDESSVQNIFKHSISDRDLEDALRDFNAGQVLIVIDACQSGQALEAEEKRRGPMNSRGLAQLAYEKGMYILAAAQSYQSALEMSALGHGLLTFSLVADGLEKQRADDDPRDGRILDREWLEYATTRVPELQLETLREPMGRSIPSARAESADVQRPKLFYRRELSSSPWVITEQSSEHKTLNDPVPAR